MAKREANPSRRVSFGPAGWLGRVLALIPVVAGLLLPARAGAQTPGEQIPNAERARIVSAVRSNELFRLMRQLTGEEALVSNGKPAFITTRHTTSGQPLRLALNFAAEAFAASGLAVEFRGWSRASYTNRNLLATQPGTLRAGEFIWFTAHLDVRSLEARAPGADDNASGCAAVLMAARVLSQYQFARSIRYVLFTGEEQGALGSAVEAERARAAGERIAGVINADMIAWDRRGPPVLRIVTRTITHGQFPQDLALASAVTNVIQAYGLAGEL